MWSVIVQKPARVISLWNLHLRTPLAGRRSAADNPGMNYPISPTALLLMLLSLAFTATAAEDDPAANDNAASAAVVDMGALYKLERSEAGNPPLDERLGQQLPADTSVLTLEVGDQRFHALRQEAEGPEPLGWILLLPDPGIGPAWTQQVEALRFDLARHGWLTLALEPPQPNPPELPERTLPVMKSLDAASAAVADPQAQAGNASDSGSNNDPENDTDDTEPLRPFGERFNERVALALEQLPRQQGEARILLAIGRAANWSAAFVAARPELDVGLILLDPLPDRQENTPLLSELWQQLGSTRVLDLYHAPLPGYPQAAPDARIRRTQAQRAKMEHYHQSKIAPPFIGWQRQMPWLTQIVRGAIKSRIVEPLATTQGQEPQARPSEPLQTRPGAPAR